MRRRIVPLLVVLGSGWFGALIFGGVLREALIVPLLYAYWYGQLLIEALPQWLIWGAFVAFAVLLTMGAWARLLDDEAEGRTRSSDAEMGEVAALAERFHLSIRGGYFHRRIRQRLRDLVGDVVAERDRRSPDRVKAELGERRDGLPDAVQPLYEPEPPRPRFGFRLLRRHDLNEFAAAIDWLDRETSGLHATEGGDAGRHDH